MTDDDLTLAKYYFKDKIPKLFVRKLKFFYFGINLPPNTYLLSNTEDTEFKYCEALQATGLVKINDESHFEGLNRFFAWFGVNTTKAVLCYFASLISLLNKYNWDLSYIKVQQKHENVYYAITLDGEEVLVAHILDTHFTLTKLQLLADKYISVFFSDMIIVSMGIEESDKQNNILSVSLSSQYLLTMCLTKNICYDMNLVLIAGLDFLVYKPAPKSKVLVRNSVAIWQDGDPKCLNYGGVYTDQDMTVCVVRDNTYAFPKLRPP